ncbi:PTS sugar transporter subunit IIA [Streptococcus caviae]|uniref:PTS sugar transporter subunit IIA n=1 Tax=Streptococcus sp. 'caviae' TaxID=1915004 RepID=UPI00094BC0C1|nr:PTS sugar transporter subunit IIA [Streptococcus sp. 'caviae']OLN82478.1 hypothetical protein BMI76_09195 [Streptococcus sp. 'caviae']
MDIIIASHGGLSAGFKDALAVILGDASDIQTEKLSAGESVEAFGERLSDKIKKSDLVNGTIIFVDLIGASPYNQAVLAVRHLSNEQAEKVFIVSNANLPMILEALNHKYLDSDITTAVESLEQFMPSRENIWHISNSLKEDEDDGF